MVDSIRLYSGDHSVLVDVGSGPEKHYRGQGYAEKTDHPEADPEDTRANLNAMATHIGLNPSDYKNKAELAEAINNANAGSSGSQGSSTGDSS